MEKEETARLNFVIHYLDRYRTLMKKASQAVMDQDVSEFPIFVIHNGAGNLGINIIHDDELAINISTLEELSTKQLISDDRIRDFIKIYKDPQSYFCLLITLLKKPSFAFLPLKGNDAAKNN